MTSTQRSLARRRSPIEHRGHQARRVADYLRDEATRGTFSIGFPSEVELADEYDVSRNVIRAALKQLSAEGLIERTPGRGTTVSHRKVEYRIDELRGLRESFDGDEVVNDVREVSTIAAPPAVARRLEVEPGSAVVFIERLRTVDGLPYSLDRTYLVEDAGLAVAGADLSHNDVFALLEGALGTRLGESEYLIEAKAADEHTARVLDVPESSPVILLDRLTRTSDGRPVDLEFISLRGDRAALRAGGTRPPLG